LRRWASNSSGTEKAQANQKKHGISFDEASTVFADPLGRLVDDAEHSEHEMRFVLFGRSSTGRLLAVLHTEREGAIRLISAREMTRNEKREYEAFRS
jgi:uncharacterized DUF497 family protein